MPPRLPAAIRTALLASRWAMLPLCLGLIAVLLVVIAQFGRELLHAVAGFPAMVGSEVTVAALKLVDLVLVANLVLVIVTAAVEAFLPAPAEPGIAAPVGLADFGALKVKVLGSISAIAAIELLETFVNIESVDKARVLWEILILLAFVMAGVLLAAMDRLAGREH